MKKSIYIAIFTATTLINSQAISETEISGKIVHESATFTKTGSTIGASSAHGKDHFKAETSARVYIDGGINDDSTYHVEVQAFNDNKAIDDYKTSEEYTQRDPLREAYIDTTIGDSWALRAGKQQTVWGTADGMKLLDIINPTDFSELAQNQMQDSRIPVWMINAEKQNEDGSNFQFIVSEPKSNYIPGFSSIEDKSVRDVYVTRGSGNFGALKTQKGPTTAAVDQNHPFIMKGVDSISGKSNGILNIIPELSTVAETFVKGGAAFAAAYGSSGYHLENWSYATVEEFVNNNGGGAGFGGFCVDYKVRGTSNALSNQASAYCLQEIAYDTNGDATNLLSGISPSVGPADWDQTNPDTAFEYMPDTTFKTFATFANAKSKYVREGADAKANLGFRYKNTTDSGLNYSFNYLRGADPNPHVDLEWQNASGQKLTVTESVDNSGNSTGYRSITLSDGGNTVYGASSGVIANPVTLVLKEKNATIQNIGGSLDTTLETESFGPVVIRGEAVYQKGVYSPVIDKAKMAIGNITEAFTTKKGDRLKYVIGADITALTNMMVSFQFIQDRNLDYVDTTTTLANAGNGSSTIYDTDVVGSKYTADLATMSLQNQYNKAEKNKEFYSIYLSKPYGESGQHRWSNIFIFEENGGKWNRLDTEYTIDDNTQLTAEYNAYFGNENTQFGQFKNSSNVQVGLKYTF